MISCKPFLVYNLRPMLTSQWYANPIKLYRGRKLIISILHPNAMAPSSSLFQGRRSIHYPHLPSTSMYTRSPFGTDLQRWIYRVDYSRVNEYGQVNEGMVEPVGVDGEEKKALTEGAGEKVESKKTK